MLHPKDSYVQYKKFHQVYNYLTKNLGVCNHCGRQASSSFLDAFTICSLATFVTATRNLALLQNCEKRHLASSCLFGRLFVLTEQPGCHWTDILEIYYWVFFENLSRNFNIHSNMARITRTLHEDQNIFLIMYHSFLHRRIHVWDKFCRESRNIFYVRYLFFSPEYHSVCEIIWKILEPDRPRVAMWLMRFACWIPKNTNALSEHAIFIAFPLQQWLHERL